MHDITELERRVAENRLVVQMVAGDLSAIRTFLGLFWPFVDIFPSLIDEGCRRHSASIRRVMSREEIRRVVHLLRSMENEEAEHRQWWLDAANAAGLSLPFSATVTQAQVEEITRHVREAAAGPLFAYLWATEQIATAVSREVLRSANFTHLMGKRGCLWFRAHADPHEHQGEEWTHEELDRMIGERILPDAFQREADRFTDLYFAATEAA